MFKYEKKLPYPVNIKRRNLKMAKAMLSQFGGANCKRYIQIEGEYMNCKYIKQKINKEIWCKYHNEKLTKELCDRCNLEDRYNKEDYTIKKKTINGKKHKLTKATEIPKEVKLKVWERDNRRCIFCGKKVPWNYANSHYIKRSQLGLGIEQNIMTNCESCHKLYEESSQREKLKEKAKKHFMSLYPDWEEKKLVYKKHK